MDRSKVYTASGDGNKSAVYSFLYTSKRQILVRRSRSFRGGCGDNWPAVDEFVLRAFPRTAAITSWSESDRNAVMAGRYM